MVEPFNKHTLKEHASFPLDDTGNYFYSHDIGLVAHLLCKHFELVSLDRTIKNKVRFTLKKTKKLNIEVNKYWDFNTSVDAQEYFNQIRRIKNQIFSSN